MARVVKAAVLLAAAVLAGCAVAPRLPEVEMPTCADAAECAQKWELAQLFVANNSGMKIQIATNVLIETYNPTNYRPVWGMRVTKEPVGAGHYLISATAVCGNMFGCGKSAHAFLTEFARYVNSMNTTASSQR